MEEKYTFYHFSPFINEETAHGGTKRSTQIIELFESIGWKRVSLDIPLGGIRNFSFFQKINLLIRGLLFWAVYTQFEKTSIMGIIRNGHYSMLIKRELATMSPDMTFVIEDYLLIGRVLMRVLRKDYPAARIIGVVHNIESLVYKNQSRVTNRISPEWIAEDIEYLNIPDLTLTISQEENWLLRCLGVDAIYVPYEASREQKDIIARIKGARAQSKKENYLVIGTATNEPTYYGMQELLTALDTENVNIRVVGNGTSSLQTTNPLIKIVGKVSEEQIISELSTCKAVIIHHLPTSGFITRMVDYTDMTIPIICNADAARCLPSNAVGKIYTSVEVLKDCLANESYKTTPVRENYSSSEALDFLSNWN